MAHAGGVLGRHVDGEPVGAPIGDDAVRLQAAMGLHLGAVFALDDDVGLREARVDVAAAWRRARARCRRAADPPAPASRRPSSGGAMLGVVDQRRVAALAPRRGRRRKAAARSRPGSGSSASSAAAIDVAATAATGAPT